MVLVYSIPLLISVGSLLDFLKLSNTGKSQTLPASTRRTAEDSTRSHNRTDSDTHAGVLILDGKYSGLASGYSEIQSVSKLFLNTEKYRAEIQRSLQGGSSRLRLEVATLRVEVKGDPSFHESRWYSPCLRGGSTNQSFKTTHPPALFRQAPCRGGVSLAG